jgi:hypothetical protein
VIRLALASVVWCAIGCQGAGEPIAEQLLDAGSTDAEHETAPDPATVWGKCPPMHWEAGKTNSATFAADVDTVQLLPGGRVLQFGWMIYDPAHDAFSSVLSKAHYSDAGHDCALQRAYASYTLLADGHTLILAGGGACDVDHVVDLVDLESGEIRLGAPMLSPRDRHLARLLPNGKVVVMGGSFGAEGSAGSELYDPSANSWSVVPTPPQFLFGDEGHIRAVSLANGDVFATGSNDADAGHTYIYSWKKNEWRESALMPFKYVPNSLVLLRDGRVMFVGIGGTTQLEGGKWLHPDERMTFIFDPVSETFAASAPLNDGRVRGAATLLACGDVLVGGGERLGTDEIVRTFELYDPARDQWFYLPAGAPSEFRTKVALVTLPNGDVLGAWGKLDPLPPDASDREDRPLLLRVDRGR